MQRTTERVAQKQRTRQALLDAARALVEEGADPTMGRVAERAGVSEATLYRYYSQPRALLRDALAVEWPELDAVLAELSAMPGLIRRAERAAIAMATFVLAREGAVRFLLSSTRQEPRNPEHPSGLPEGSFRRRLASAVLDGVDGLSLDDRLSLELALIVIISPQAVLILADAMPERRDNVPGELARMVRDQIAGHGPGC